MAHFAKSLWSPFEAEFKSTANDLQRLNGEVKEEIRLASYQAAEQDRRLQVIERRDAQRNRILARWSHDTVHKLSREEQDWKLKAAIRRSSKLAYT